MVQTEKLNQTETLGRMSDWIKPEVVTGPGKSREYKEANAEEDNTLI